MNFRFLSLVPIFSLVCSVNSYALTDAQCFDAYVNATKNNNLIGQPLSYGGGAVIVGALVAHFILDWIGAGVSAVAVLGGTTVGSIGNDRLANAYFDNNLAQSIVEARAHVVGPYTSQLVSDLNDAIYNTGRFQPKVNNNGSVEINSPLTDDTKNQLNMILTGQRISAADLSEADIWLLQYGALCTFDGRPLGQDDWARWVGSYVAQKKAR